MSEVNHSERKHALLSASGSSRWMECTVSPRLEESFQNVESSYAREGTLAHEFAEINLKYQLKLITKKQYLELREPLEKEEFYSSEMEEEVQKHIDYVIAEFNAAKKKTKDAVLLIEEKIDLSYYIKEGFGTGDDIVIADGFLEIIDLKYGKGVRVSAIENKQGMLYALGVLREYEMMYDIHTIKITITQPRMDSISTWEISANDLRKFGEEQVKVKAELAFKGEGEQKPGDWCRFCKAKVNCRAIYNANLEVAKHEFKDPMLISDEEILDVYSKSKQITDWLSSVSSHVQSEALKGKKWSGLKLVEGRSNRIIIKHSEVIDLLIESGYSRDQIVNEKIKGLGDLEKLLTKKKFTTVLGDYIIKPVGSPTLVPEEDKRPEFGVNKAQEDFNEDDDDLLG